MFLSHGEGDIGLDELVLTPDPTLEGHDLHGDLTEFVKLLSRGVEPVLDVGLPHGLGVAPRRAATRRAGTWLVSQRTVSFAFVNLMLSAVGLIQ